jgi:hypothetical protein
MTRKISAPGFLACLCVVGNFLLWQKERGIDADLSGQRRISLYGQIGGGFLACGSLRGSVFGAECVSLGFECVVLSSECEYFVRVRPLSGGGSGGGRGPRLFDRPECKNCVFKGGSYCWRQCPYNVWRKEQY